MNILLPESLHNPFLFTIPKSEITGWKAHIFLGS